jgi:hypothetical protein
VGAALSKNFADKAAPPTDWMETNYKEGRRPLLVSFSGMAHQRKGLPPFEFRRIARDLPVNLLRLRDNHQLWFQAGIPGVSANPAETARFIQSQIYAINPTRLVAVGSSMGGYAALLFGTLLGFDEVHAFSPKTFLHPWRRLAIGDYWFWRYQFKLFLYWGRSHQWWDLRDVLHKIPPRGRVHIYYDPNFRIDRRHAQHLSGLPRVILHTQPGGSHTLVRQMAESGELIRLLKTALRVEAEPAESPEAVE